MKIYKVFYNYNTTNHQFACNFGVLTIKAISREEAIRKARKTAPNNARGFAATLVG